MPLHRRSVAAAEGFTAFAERRARLEAFLRDYGCEGSTDDVLDALRARLRDQVATLRERAATDPTYTAMVVIGRDGDLEQALRELDDL